MKFIDLFAGLGGFHLALEKLGHECVFASEIDPKLQSLYEKNFGLKPAGDIKKVHEKDIPKHDIMCAGFPCQPFSKAGKQLGIADYRGTFFIEDIKRILKYHKPKYFILENVPNLRKHDRQKTWKLIENTLKELGYNVKEHVLSPHEFGIPQIRKRIYIVGSLKSLDSFNFPTPTHKNSEVSIKDILEKNIDNVKKLTKKQIECINLWQKIINKIPKEEKLPSFPIWGMEFEANYPFEEKSPYYTTSIELSRFKGSLGMSLKKKSKKEQLILLPSYARVQQRSFPEWKKKFIRQNREFYKAHKKIIKPFIKELKKFPPSWQKLEWNCLDGERNLYNYIIQFRASGIRIKRPNAVPALVVTSTQLPIIGWEQRYLTVKEAAKLQALDELTFFEDEINRSLRALGNAVNAYVVRKICLNLFEN